MALHPQPAVNIISLCTGGYGLDFGVDLAMPSARSVCLVEREAFAVARLVAAMREGLIPEAAIWSDARTFNGRPWRGLVDGVIGGIPCQPHSLAGRRRGVEDPRDLWSTARRIIAQSGAWWCLIENVPGMLSAPKKYRKRKKRRPEYLAGAERVWRDLQRLGFKVEGGLFSAAEVGASHERQRLFILGVADARCVHLERWGKPGELRGAQGSGEGQGLERQRHGHAVGHGRQDVADGHDAGSSIAARQPGNDGSQCAAAERVRGDVVDAFGIGRSARRDNHGPDVRHEPDTTGQLTMVDANLVVLCDEPSTGKQPQPEYQHGLGIFPPSPNDIEGWRDILARAPQLEPAVRRVADGVASRVDQLRLLGNGVVSLEGAHAFRTLAPRLAARGSAGAAFLCGLMEAAE